jgi:hypothetical protein
VASAPRLAGVMPPAPSSPAREFFGGIWFKVFSERGLCEARSSL